MQRPVSPETTRRRARAPPDPAGCLGAATALVEEAATTAAASASSLGPQSTIALDLTPRRNAAIRRNSPAAMLAGHAAPGLISAKGRGLPDGLTRSSAETDVGWAETRSSRPHANRPRSCRFRTMIWPRHHASEDGRAVLPQVPDGEADDARGAGGARERDLRSSADDGHVGASDADRGPPRSTPGASGARAPPADRSPSRDRPARGVSPPPASRSARRETPAAAPPPPGRRGRRRQARRGGRSGCSSGPRHPRMRASRSRVE